MCVGGLSVSAMIGPPLVWGGWSSWIRASGAVLRCVVVGGGVGCLVFIDGEFDPGSGRTLAACLTHASRTVNPFGGDQWRTGE